MVDPDFRSMRIGKRLYDARKKLVRERNLKRIVIGGRVPNYHKYADSMSIYDIEFPEICRIATRNGAQLFFVPFCTDERHGYLRVRYCSQARAIENQVFVATAGCVGNIPSVENMDINYAQSGIYTPSDFPFARDGIAGECQPNIETVVIADVDLDVLRRNRLRGTVRTWQDRRTDLYDVIEKKKPPEKS
jgi:predicted amidohydrolase